MHNSHLIAYRYFEDSYKLSKFNWLYKLNWIFSFGNFHSKKRDPIKIKQASYDVRLENLYLPCSLFKIQYIYYAIFEVIECFLFPSLFHLSPPLIYFCRKRDLCICTSGQQQWRKNFRISVGLCLDTKWMLLY